MSMNAGQTARATLLDQQRHAFEHAWGERCSTRLVFIVSGFERNMNHSHRERMRMFVALFDGLLTCHILQYVHFMYIHPLISTAWHCRHDFNSGFRSTV